MPRKPIPEPPKKKRNSAPQVIQTPLELATMGHHHPELFTLTENVELFRAACRAQELLPPHRRRPEKSLEISIKYARQYFERTLRLMREGMALHSIQDCPVYTPPATEPELPKTLVFWRPMHYTALAHHPAVKPLIIDRDKPPRAADLVDALTVAQHEVLLSHEWRKRAPLGQSFYSGTLLPALLKGLEQPAPKAIEPEVTMTESLAQAQTEAEAEPQAVPDWVQHNEKIAQAHETPKTPGLTDVLAVGAAYLRGLFKSAMQEAIEESEERVTRRVMGEFVSRLEGSTQGSLPTATVVAPKTAEVVDAVRAMMIDLIGAPPAPPAPVAAPAAPIEVPPDPQPQRAALERKPRVDVIGLKGTNCELVRRRCGSLFDLRFLDPDEARHQLVTAPHAIVCRKFVPHTATDRIDESTEIIYVEGAARSVVKRLHEMRNHA